MVFSGEATRCPLHHNTPPHQRGRHRISPSPSPSLPLLQMPPRPLTTRVSREVFYLSLLQAPSPPSAEDGYREWCAGETFPPRPLQREGIAAGHSEQERASGLTRARRGWYATGNATWGIRRLRGSLRRGRHLDPVVASPSTLSTRVADEVPQVPRSRAACGAATACTSAARCDPSSPPLTLPLTRPGLT